MTTENRGPSIYQKVALITGITGQDGSYLAEFLLAKGYRVHGLVRRSSTLSRSRIDHLFDRDKSDIEDQHLQLHYGDLNDSGGVLSLLLRIKPDEIYNLGAQAHVKVSFEMPEYTGEVTGLGALRIFEAVREAGIFPRIFQAGSSEMFGKVQMSPQNEETPFQPRSPYGAAKLYSHWMGVSYREAYGLFIANGLLYNHESPRRGENFVTRKISLAAAAIKFGLQTSLTLGNIESKRDWGWTEDYVEAMWLMLQHETPDDFVIATGEAHSVREFCEIAFDHVGLDWKEYVKTDAKLLRPADAEMLIGDSSKAKRLLGWNPKVDFKGLVTSMVDADLARLKGPGPEKSWN